MKTLIDQQCGLRFASCPRWIHQKLYFLDVHDRCVKSADVNGNIETEVSLPFMPGGLDVDHKGAILVSDAWRQSLHSIENMNVRQTTDLSEVSSSRLSDAIVSWPERVYVGDVGYDFLDPLVDPVKGGRIMLVDGDGQVSVVAAGLFFPNCIVITPDGGTLIVGEALAHRLTVFDINPDGKLENRRLWAQLPETFKPSGICLDNEGAIWAATTTPMVIRVLEGGTISDEVVTERDAFGVALGGPQHTDLFMCTSASTDPLVTRRTPCASIEVASVTVASSPVLAKRVANLRAARP